MAGIYEDSWKLYKAHTENFSDDVLYYQEFIEGYDSLELFAGYGRLTNKLAESGADIEAVEIEPRFAQFIDLPKNRIHVMDVLDFQPGKKYDRIFAAYNSFCLLTSDEDVRRFFSLLDSYLKPGGLVSLSYYHTDFWDSAYRFSFDFEGDRIDYEPGFDLSEKDESGTGVWIDTFFAGEVKTQHKYVTKIYESSNDIEKAMAHTSLELREVVTDFNNENVEEPGWIDYVLERN